MTDEILDIENMDLSDFNLDDIDVGTPDDNLNDNSFEQAFSEANDVEVEGKQENSVNPFQTQELDTDNASADSSVEADTADINFNLSDSENVVPDEVSDLTNNESLNESNGQFDGGADFGFETGEIPEAGAEESSSEGVSDVADTPEFVEPEYDQPEYGQPVENNIEDNYNDDFSQSHDNYSANEYAQVEESDNVGFLRWYSGSSTDSLYEIKKGFESGRFEADEKQKGIHVNVGHDSYGWSVQFADGVTMNLHDVREYQIRNGRLPFSDGRIIYGKSVLEFANIERIVVYESVKYFSYGV